MNIINGSIDRRYALLNASNLREIPFSRTEPTDETIDRVFVGRVQQLQDAAWRTVDRPRNILVLGGYGLGKTTFIRKLLRDLHGAKTVSFLTGYAPLQSDSPQGFQLAALGALVEGALSKAPPGSRLYDFALKTREELARLDSSTPESVRAPFLRFQEGLKLAQGEGFKRVVIAVDEIDKRDAQVVQAILMGSRFLLDMEASFLLTGRFLDAFSDIRASLLAAFEHRVELRPFSAEESREIIQRNLATARPEGCPLPPASLEPFEEPVVEEINRRARGLPRPLNLMAESALQQALAEALEQGAPRFTVTLKHLDGALRNEGNLVFNEVGAEARQMLARIFQRNGYIGGADLDALSSGGLPETMRSLEELSRRDAVLPVGRADETAFALSPSVEQTLTRLRQLHEKLQALWSEVLTATDKHTSGRALEEFASVFFGEVFRVSERNVRTDTEEFDLLLERTDRTDSRFHDTYLVVECKNWKSQPVGQNVVSEMLGKLVTRHRKQAFLLASGEVTSDAKMQALHAFSSTGVEILVLDGNDLKGFVGSMKTVGDFLNEKHKSQTVLRTFSPG
jgi:type II secretory pathway predicted ATPase ExeA